MSIEVRGVCTLIQVFDMPTSVRFYRDVLGFEIVRILGNLFGEFINFRIFPKHAIICFGVLYSALVRDLVYHTDVFGKGVGLHFSVRARYIQRLNRCARQAARNEYLHDAREKFALTPVHLFATT